MTKEEKTLLTKVLCEQLPYGVKIRIEYPFVEEKDWHPEDLCGLDLRRQVIADTSIRIEEFKPYLRPMSSMTDEEKGQTRGFWIGADTRIFATRLIDFYNKNHFDYLGLIPKGLAIAAVGNDNPYNEEGGTK